jgi:hypothetical protein
MKKPKPKTTRADRIRAMKRKNLNRDIIHLHNVFDRLDNNINLLREII